MYASPARAATNVAAETIRHLAASLDHALGGANAAAEAYQWVWIIDFAGFSLSHALQVRTATATLSTFVAHFPERLGAALMINTPAVLEMLCVVMRPLLDARTLDKVHVVSVAPDSVATEFGKHGITDAAQLSFLAAVLRTAAEPGTLPPRELLGGQDAELALPRLPPAPREAWTPFMCAEGGGGGMGYAKRYTLHLTPPPPLAPHHVLLPSQRLVLA